MTSVASSISTISASSCTLPLPRYVFMRGLESFCTSWPTTDAPAVSVSAESSRNGFDGSTNRPGRMTATRTAFSATTLSCSRDLGTCCSTGKRRTRGEAGHCTASGDVRTTLQRRRARDYHEEDGTGPARRFHPCASRRRSPPCFSSCCSASCSCSSRWPSRPAPRLSRRCRRWGRVAIMGSVLGFHLISIVGLGGHRRCIGRLFGQRSVIRPGQRDVHFHASRLDRGAFPARELDGMADGGQVRQHARQIGDAAPPPRRQAAASARST